MAVACGTLALLFIACNHAVSSVQGRIGLFALAVCMNLLQIYNLFLAGVERTIQALGSIEVGRGDNEDQFFYVKRGRLKTVVLFLFYWSQSFLTNS